MSKYTTEVRWICETSVSHPVSGNGFDNIDEIINASHTNVFNFSYPIFDAQYRAPLEKKILRHFYTREICEETVGLWKLRLCDKLNVIMPYYNQLYESALLEFNPLYDIDYTRQGEKSVEGSDISVGSSNVSEESDKSNTDNLLKVGSSNTERNETGEGKQTNTATSQSSGSKSGESEGWNLYSDTPQGTVVNLDNNTYLTNATKTTNENSDTENKSEFNTDIGTSNTTNTITSSDNVTDTENRTKNENVNKSKNESVTKSTDKNDFVTYTERVFGKRSGKDYSKMLAEFRKTFLNIDEMILNELEPLFFGLW